MIVDAILRMSPTRKTFRFPNHEHEMTVAVKKAQKRKKELAEQSLAESFFSGIIKLQ